MKYKHPFYEYIILKVTDMKKNFKGTAKFLIVFILNHICAFIIKSNGNIHKNVRPHILYFNFYFFLHMLYKYSSPLKSTKKKCKNFWLVVILLFWCITRRANGLIITIHYCFAIYTQLKCTNLYILYKKRPTIIWALNNDNIV